MPVTLDSLVANEFAVEINGVRVNGVFRVSSLVTFSLTASGTQQSKPFEVTKMVERDANAPFNKWLRDTRADGAGARREVTVLAIDDGIVTRRWTARNAYITEVHYSAFDSASVEMVAETFAILYDVFEEAFPTSG
jgi:hypothetical protein